MNTMRLTMAQALILYLANQHVERDGVENPFFAGVWGIFGHGNVAGIGQALEQYADKIRYYQSRNEQAQVHTAVAYTKMKNRLQTFACTSSIGPGATNMLTGAALATVNRLPVLLLPGDIFADYIHPCWERFDQPHELLTPAWLDAVRAANLGIICWHEERPAVIAALHQLGVNGICSDRPELLLP